MLVPSSAGWSPLIADRTRTLGQFCIVGSEDAAFASRHVLRPLKAKRSKLAETPHTTPLPCGPVRVRAIFDHDEIVSLTQCRESVHVCGTTGEVNEDDGARSLVDGFFDRLRIEIDRLRINISKHRNGPDARNCGRGSDEGDGRDDHLIARTNSAGDQRNLKRNRAVGGGDAIPRPVILGEAPLQFADSFVISAPGPAFQHVEQGLAVRLIEDGPSRLLSFERRRAAEQSKLRIRMFL